jgi:membrane protein DedA with SNARE-associated domain
MEVFDTLLPIFTHYGYLAVFVMLIICGFGVPIPEDVTLVTGGVIAGLGYAKIDVMLAVGLAGVMVGDGLIFLLGRWYGQRIIALPFFRKVLTPERFASAQDRFARYGKWVMFVARFLPGLRTPVFFTAGMTRRVPFYTWLLMDGAAALLSVPIWVYLGYYGALKIDWLFGMVERGQYVIFSLLALGGLVLAFVWWRRLKKKLALAENIKSKHEH